MGSCSPLKNHEEQSISISHHTSPHCDPFLRYVEDITKWNYLTIKMFPGKLFCKPVGIENSTSLYRRDLYSPRQSPYL